MLTLDHEVAPAVSSFFADLRAREFSRLDANGHAYLDFTGSALYPDSLVTSHATLLRSGVFGNPHAENPASTASTSIINAARQRVLGFLDADAADHVVIFTANATGAIALVAAGFPFGPDAPLVLTADNHNSVNGVREYARRAGAAVHYLPLTAQLRLDAPDAALRKLSTKRGLFAFPAQSNFSGVKHPLSLVRAAQANGFRVLLDAAALLPHTRLSLRDVPADFVALSFYKMFGYPTGVGALVARHSALAELGRPWFSGGTVNFVSVQNEVYALRDGEDAFEDGTANFLAIAAIPAGLDFLETLHAAGVDEYASSLTAQCGRRLAELRHRNGAPLVEMHGSPLDDRHGATIAFNVLDNQGMAIPYSIVERRAHAARVSVRGGCFCNPGAAEAAFGFSAEMAKRCLASVSAEGWSIDRFRECMDGSAVGAVRASFGAPSSARDVERLLRVVGTFA